MIALPGTGTLGLVAGAFIAGAAAGYFSRPDPVDQEKVVKVVVRDQAQAAADRAEIDALTTRIEEMQHELEDGGRECFGARDADRLRSLWNTPAAR